MKAPRLSSVAYLGAAVCLGMSAGAVYLFENPVMPASIFYGPMADLLPFAAWSAFVAVILVVLGVLWGHSHKGENPKAWGWCFAAWTIALALAVAIVPPVVTIGGNAIQTYQDEHAPAVKVSEAEAVSVALGPDVVKGERYRYLGAWSQKPYGGSIAEHDNLILAPYALLVRDTATGLYFAPLFDPMDMVEYNFEDVIRASFVAYERAMKNPLVLAKAKELAGSGNAVVSAAEIKSHGVLYIQVRERARLATPGLSTSYSMESSATGEWQVQQD
jgi:hypothetical protein